MQISQLQQNSSQKKAVSQLAKKWQAIQRQMNQNAGLDKKMQDFFELYKQKLGADETQFSIKRAQLVEHFCHFIPRKTMVNTAMDNLVDYIEEEMELLGRHPFTDPEAVQRLYKLKLAKIQERREKYAIDAKMINRLRDEVQSMPWMPDELSDEDIAEIIRNPEKASQDMDERYEKWCEEQGEESIEDDLEDLEEIFADAHWGEEDDNFFTDDPFTNDSDFEQDEQGHAEHQGFFHHKANDDGDLLLKQLMKSEQINKLYKKLANLLHPDKLKDASKRDEYLAAMKELIAAKKNKDIFGVLSLAQRYMPEHDLAIDKAQEKQLLKALDRKLQDLQDEYHEAQDAPTVEGTVWRRFYHKSKRQQEENFKEQKALLQELCDDTDFTIAQTHNVQKLKSYLRQHYSRIDQQSFAQFAEAMMNEFGMPPEFGEPPF